MLYVDHAILKTWNPPLRNAVGRPVWTKVTVQDLQLTNTLEQADWDADLAKVYICPQCGEYGCFDGGYARISRLGNHLLWTADYLDDTLDQLSLDDAALAIYEHASVAIPEQVWDSWRQQAPGLPAAQRFHTATRRELLSAWRLEAPPGLREQPLMEMLARLAHHMLASDSMDKGQALDRLHEKLDWFVEAPDQPLTGDLQPLQQAQARLETFYLDGAPGEDWPALAYHQGEWRIALGAGWFYSPG